MFDHTIQEMLIDADATIAALFAAEAQTASILATDRMEAAVASALAAQRASVISAVAAQMSTTGRLDRRTVTDFYGNVLIAVVISFVLAPFGMSIGVAHVLAMALIIMLGFVTTSPLLSSLFFAI